MGNLSISPPSIRLALWASLYCKRGASCSPLQSSLWRSRSPHNTWLPSPPWTNRWRTWWRHLAPLLWVPHHGSLSLAPLFVTSQVLYCTPVPGVLVWTPFSCFFRALPGLQSKVWDLALPSIQPSLHHLDMTIRDVHKDVVLGSLLPTSSGSSSFQSPLPPCQWLQSCCGDLTWVCKSQHGKLYNFQLSWITSGTMTD